MNTKERDAKIVRMYLEENKKVPEIAAAVGVGMPRIYQILADNGVKRDSAVARAAQAARSKEEGLRAFSQVHVNLGLKLYSKRQFVDELTRDVVAQELNWSMKKLALVEKGETELSLTDLQQMAKFLKVSLNELFIDSEVIGTGVWKCEEEVTSKPQ